LYLASPRPDKVGTDDDSFVYASRNGHLAVVECLISHGANIHVDNDIAFRYASYNCHMDIVELLNNHINKKKEIEELQKQLLDIQNKINTLTKTQ